MKNLFRISSVYLDIFIRFFLVLIKKDYEAGHFFFIDINLKINSGDVLHMKKKKKINKIVNILFKFFFSQN